jgi:Fe-S-cluster containining protein
MLDETRDTIRCEDCEIIADMVIPIEPPSHLIEKLGLRPDVNRYCYTCRHLLGNKNCAIYENRPRMCSGYPYGKKCVYPGCTYTGLGTNLDENEQADENQ